MCTSNIEVFNGRVISTLRGLASSSGTPIVSPLCRTMVLYFFFIYFAIFLAFLFFSPFLLTLCHSFIFSSLFFSDFESFHFLLFCSIIALFNIVQYNTL